MAKLKNQPSDCLLKCSFATLHCQLKCVCYEAKYCVFCITPIISCFLLQLQLKALKSKVSCYHSVDGSYALNCWFRNSRSVLLACPADGLIQLLWLSLCCSVGIHLCCWLWGREVCRFKFVLGNFWIDDPFFISLYVCTNSKKKRHNTK